MQKTKPVIVWDEQQKKVIDDAIIHRKSMVILGSAGSGKSTIIHELIRQCKLNTMHVGVTATTGCAAVLIGGTTIHSYLKMGLGEATAANIVKEMLSKNKRVAKSIIELKMLIIDEVSMLNDELFTKISKILSILRNNELPFGGVQMILVGDFYQLPPVSGEFCFTSPVWEQMNFTVHILSKIYRQEDMHFQSILEKVKNGKVSEEDMALLEKCKETQFPEYVKPTRLYSLNVDVHKINMNEYNKLDTPEECYPSIYFNKKSEYFGNSLKIPLELKMRVGAQVMITRNIDPEIKIVNGTRGVVVETHPNVITIKLLNNRLYDVSRTTITSTQDDDIRIEYMPLALAWAVTIHKSQGLTLDCAEMDLGNSVFQCGQGYTALSRVKDLNSVRIVNLSKRAFKTHPEVKSFYQQMNKKQKD